MLQKPQWTDEVEVIMGILTGSRAYGEPRSDSDVDLALFVDPRLATILRNAADPHNADHPGVRFGRLNLILCESQEEYDKWHGGTLKLIGEAPVTRDAAKAEFRSRNTQDYSA